MIFRSILTAIFPATVFPAAFATVPPVSPADTDTVSSAFPVDSATVPAVSPAGSAIVPSELPADSLLFILPLLLLIAASLSLFWYTDRRLLPVILRSFGLALLRLIVAGCCVWLLWHNDRWWLSLLTIIAIFAIFSFQLSTSPAAKSGAFIASQSGNPQSSILNFLSPLWRMVLVMVAAMVIAVAVVSGLLMVCIPTRLFLPVAMILAAGIHWPLAEAMRAYNASLSYTKEHRIFLLANGATHLESLLPSVRRGLRAALTPLLKRQTATASLLGPMLFWGMLIAGASVATALLYTVLLTFATFATALLTIVLAIAIYDRMTNIDKGLGEIKTQEQDNQHNANEQSTT
jgi:ABC-type iron transport system FetAB permease component